MNAASVAVVGALSGLTIAAGIGLAIGVIARLLMAGRDPADWGATLLLGIFGAWVGSFLFARFGMGSTLPGLIGALLGAMVLLAAREQLRRGRRRTLARDRRTRNAYRAGPAADIHPHEMEQA